MNFNDWFHILNGELVIPRVRRTARVEVAWAYTESGKAGAGLRNPLNTTWRLTASTAPSGIASTDYNWVHVQNYATIEDGIYATKRTLLQDAYGMPRLLRKLRSTDASADDKLQAIVNAQWGTESLLYAVYEDVKQDYWSRADTTVAGT